jgi:hypothetical protein
MVPLLNDCFQDRSVLHTQDSRGLHPVHVACMNTHDEGPDILETLLEIDHLAARQTDHLGQVKKNVNLNTTVWR